MAKKAPIATFKKTTINGILYVDNDSEIKIEIDNSDEPINIIDYLKEFDNDEVVITITSETEL